MTGEPVLTRPARCQLLSDGRTVWVNDRDGACISRFGRLGVDVHNTLADQRLLGKECLACTHGCTHLADWRSFQVLTRRYHNVGIGDEHMPDFIREEMQASG